MQEIQKIIEVNANVETCFNEWMKFEQFPRFMKNIKSIVKKDNQLWHWVVSGPLGASLEWDAVMDGKIEDRMVSWHTVSDSAVKNHGKVLFKQLSDNITQISALIQYEVTGGIVGESIGKLLSNPSKMVEEALQNFKQLIENVVHNNSVI